jgi:hypothetical protein
LTAYTPYTSMNESTGRCQVSNVQREVTADVSALYPEPEPPRFPDITEGAAITVKNGDGSTLAAARLGAAKLVETYQTTAPGYADGADVQVNTAPEQVTHGFCAYQFAVSDLPDSAFYRVQFGAQPEMTIGRSSRPTGRGNRPWGSRRTHVGKPRLGTATCASRRPHSEECADRPLGPHSPCPLLPFEVQMRQTTSSLAEAMKEQRTATTPIEVDS